MDKYFVKHKLLKVLVFLIILTLFIFLMVPLFNVSSTLNLNIISNKYSSKDLRIAIDIVDEDKLLVYENQVVNDNVVDFVVNESSYFIEDSFLLIKNYKYKFLLTADFLYQLENNLFLYKI